MDAFQDKWPRWRQLTSTAAHRGVLCLANRGNKVTYTDPHRWLPGLQPDDGDIALRELVRRYLFAYGPAMPQHFAKWLNIPPSRADSLFDEMDDELEPVDWTANTLGFVAGDERRRNARTEGSACCRTSTRSSSQGNLASGCSPARRPPVR